MEKLIRDHIQGLDYSQTRKADKKEAYEFLKGKLHETVQALTDSNYKSLEEFADVQEVLNDLVRKASFRLTDVEVARIIKLKERGGFSNLILKKR